MNLTPQHGWDLSRDEARRLQRALAANVLLTDDLPEITTIGGVHVSYPRTESGGVTSRAAVVVLLMQSLETIESHLATRPITFPAEASLRSFRDAPVALAALDGCRRPPDLLLVSGQGASRPGEFGIAGHLGVVLDIPTIGCWTTPPDEQALVPDDYAGAWAPLHDGQEVAGAALRTRANNAPVYVAPGHRVSLESAIRLVLASTVGHRMPEPLRLAASHHRTPRQRREAAP